MTDQVRVLIADDHPVVRRGLRALLTDAEGLTVVGEAAGGEEAVSAVTSHTVDVVLMDLRMGDGLDGVEATRRITALPDPPRILVLTTHNTDTDILNAVEAGATGYLLKDTPPDELLSAVRATARGETVLALPVATRLLGRVRAPQLSLTPRELEILGLLAQGMSNRQAARALRISEATVKTHLVHVFAKLGVDSRTGAVSAAMRQRLIPSTE